MCQGKNSSNTPFIILAQICISFSRSDEYTIKTKAVFGERKMLDRFNYEVKGILIFLNL